MKALIINSQGNSEEAFALAKLALKNDMKSHICWHVYGLLYRSVKNFEEAIKAYKFALRLEPESQQIQRDLALLQMQMRDYPGYIQSRRAILQARTALRQNWTALAVAQHLAGDLTDAERTLTAYEETLKLPLPKSDLEVSEAILYKNNIIAEMGEVERALEHLDAVAKHCPDRTAVMEMRAQFLLTLGRMEEAANAYRALLSRNAENRSYYDGLQAALGLQAVDVASLKSLFEEYAEKNPRGNAARRIPLDLFEGKDFREAADKYLQHLLRKGVPSTFTNVKALYSNSSKQAMILDLVEGYFKGESTNHINGAPEVQINGDTTLVFQSSIRYFLAQHYNYHLSRDLGKAMKIINEEIASNPESVDYHMTRARILKHYGNTQDASETMEKARTLDIRDRYINTKAAKYQLRNNENEAALKTMSKFTRNEAVGGPLGDLHDMQCVWYITEDGEAYMRQGQLGLALKRFTSVYNIFEIWQEDQFDFHTFSLRKGQIRAYIDMIRWEDRLREHPFFSRAAISAVRVYIVLYDQTHPTHGSHTNGVNGTIEKQDTPDPKKAQKKARKDQQRQEQIAAEKKDAKKTNAVSVEGEPRKEDKDPKGEKLLQTSEPLTDAMKFVTPLLEFSPKNFEAQAVGFEVFLRRSEYHPSILPTLRPDNFSSKISPRPPLPPRLPFSQSLRSYRPRATHPASTPYPLPSPPQSPQSSTRNSPPSSPMTPTSSPSTPVFSAHTLPAHLTPRPAFAPVTSWTLLPAHGTKPTYCRC
jgi:N-alpha-acetyltransferase 15/16, NatA auxiliary subunit